MPRHLPRNIEMHRNFTSNAGVVGDPDPAVIVVGDSSHLTGAPRPVLIVSVIARHRVIIIVVYIRTGPVMLQKENKGNLKQNQSSPKSLIPPTLSPRQEL